MDDNLKSFLDKSAAFLLTVEIEKINIVLE